MRITGGTLKGRTLETPKGRNIRPTSDKVRQAIFNMLEARSLIHDAYVIDAFCGSGALGLEALSRGASSALFIDKSRESLMLAKRNAQSLDVEAEFLKKDTSKLTKNENHPPANLVFLDPPYDKGLLEPSIKALMNGGWLKDDAYFFIEMGKRETLFTEGLRFESEKIYGDTKILLLQKVPE